MSYPFESINLPKNISSKIGPAEAANMFDDLIAEIRREKAFFPKQDNLDLILSWALTQNVKAGIHIDNLAEGMEESVTLFEAFKSTHPGDLPEDILEYEHNMQVMHERAKAFAF